MPITALLRRKDDWVPFSRNGSVPDPDLDASAPDKRHRILSDAMVAGWHSALMSNEAALRWLKERRGLNTKTLERYEIGMQNEKYYTIPIRDIDRSIWNIRYYNPNPTDERRKIWSESGYGSPPRLYPMSIFEEDPEEIIIGGGEWDILLTLQNGFAAITRTGNEDFWLAEWGEWFKDRIVYLAHDCDEKGQKANRVAGRALQHVADVRVIQLPYAILPKHGKDLTDYLLDHEPGALRTCMEAAEPFLRAKPIRETHTVSVLDTQDARRVGKPVRVVVTVKGRKEPGYTIPSKIRLACTQDAGTKCNICPMRAVNGEAEVEVTPDSPLVLNLVEHTANEVSKVIADFYGVPGGKCVKLVQEVDEYQAVEVLFARPALDSTDGADVRPEAAQYKTIKITSVGRHDTPPNNTVSIIGALHPNPKTQHNEFLAHELELLETSVDRFQLNANAIKQMKIFQTPRNPLSKLRSIARSLAEHVTMIHGRPAMHILMDLTFHSALSFTFAGELVERGWLESLVVGDTRTGKSLAAQRLVRHYGAGEIISCEAASFAGVIGGLQQIGGRDWAVTWGIVPINDRRLVVLDEISGLTPDQIAAMSDIRSSGRAKLTKIEQEATWARTRLLWLGNPRNATMANYTWGVDAIKPLIGNAEDIARFDLAMAVTLGDVPAEIINKRVESGEFRYTSEACQTLLRWVWTRTPEQIIFGKRAENVVFNAANEIGKLYVEDPPLIQAANIRIKIARVAVAIAARTFSTDRTHQKIMVLPDHVGAAVKFLNSLYGMQEFGYRERSKDLIADRREAENNREKISEYLRDQPTLAKFLRSAGKFRRQDIEEIMQMSREEANGVIYTLYQNRMVRKVLGDVVVEPTLHSILREHKR